MPIACRFCGAGFEPAFRRKTFCSSVCQRAHLAKYRRISEVELRRLYLEERQTTREIARLFQVDKATISNCLHRYHIPVRVRRNTFVFTTFDENLAYLTGVYLGDGWATTHQFGLRVKDQEFAEAAYGAASNLGLRAVCRPDSYWKGMFFTAVYSNSFAAWLKTLTLPRLKDLTELKETRWAFLRGFYDSEGSLFKDKRGYYRLAMSNGNPDLLRLISELLESLGIRARLYVTRVRHLFLWINDHYAIPHLDQYCLQINRQGDIKTFISNTRPNIPRKARCCL